MFGVIKIKEINEKVFETLDTGKKYIIPFFKPQKVKSDNCVKGKIINREVKVLFKGTNYVLFGFDYIDENGNRILLKESYMKHDFILKKLTYGFKN